MTIIIAQFIIQNLTHRGHWYLQRAKFTTDSKFLDREIGWGRGLQKRSLEMQLQGGGRRWWRQVSSSSALWLTSMLYYLQCHWHHHIRQSVNYLEYIRQPFSGHSWTVWFHSHEWSSVWSAPCDACEQLAGRLFVGQHRCGRPVIVNHQALSTLAPLSQYCPKFPWK